MVERRKPIEPQRTPLQQRRTVRAFENVSGAPARVHLEDRSRNEGRVADAVTRR